MKSFVFIFLLFSSISAPAQSTVEIFLRDDMVALRQAMNDAYNGDPNDKTIISAYGYFNFADAVSGLPEVRTHVVIKGPSDPVTFIGGGEQFANLFKIQAGGHLELHNVELRDFSLEAERLNLNTYTDQSLIINHGILELTNVQISSLEAQSMRNILVRLEYAPIIKNSASGQLHLNRVSLINSGTGLDGGIIFNDGIVEMQNTQVYYSRDGWAAPFRNNRSMSMKNISMFRFMNNGTLPVLSMPGAESYMSNSVISGFDGKFCNTVTSLGHNLVDNDQCEFKAAGDIVGESAGLSWRPVEVSCCHGWNHSFWNPILTHALIPFASSPAVDSIEPELCPYDDLIRGRGISDGNADGIAKCDMGAIELYPVHLDQGGINGVYYDPDADGHFITIIDNDYNTLVMWNSFDKNGNQYFVSATGELVAGRSLIGDAYTTVSGGTTPEGDILPAQAVHWGTLEVDMISCNEGTLAFQSDFPEIGSGQVQLVRLAYVKQLGCVD
jgi:hypothetical protein